MNVGTTSPADYCITIKDAKTGEKVCRIESMFNYMFAKLDGKLISFRGKESGYGTVIPHVKDYCKESCK